MSTNDENNGETAINHDQLLSLLTTYTPYAAIYELSKELFDEKNHEHLISLVDKHRAENTVNQQIQAWKNEGTNSKRTRVIVKINNNTSHTLKLIKTDRAINQSDRDALVLFPDAPMTFKCEFDYKFPYGSRSRTLFNQYMDFADAQTGVRFEFGLHLNSSFGVLTPTLKPIRKNIVTAFGNFLLTASTRIIEASNEAPYNFTVEITLGR
jgi:hypothetical protein